MSDRLSKYTLLPISWDAGVNSSTDSALISPSAISEGINVVLDDKGVLSKVSGRQKYNATEVGSSVPVKGRVSFLAEDGVEYEIIACNSKLYWTNGNGTYTAVKFATENVDITISPSLFHRFVVYDRNIGGTQKKIAYCVTNGYPVATNTAGTANKYTAISRAIRLEVSSSVVIGKSVYRDDDNSRSAGSDDVEVGADATEVGWPSKAKYITRIFDRVIVANYQDDSGNTMKNGWIASEAQNSEDWTNSSVAANSGGGKYPDEFTGIQVIGTSVLMFTRRGILNLSCTPSAITNWREYWLNTTLGAINQEAICLHTDGWVYFCSEVGICRTDGRIAERCDYDIETDIQSLTQLKNNTRNKILNTTADWDAGTPASGGVILDTSNGELKQKPQTTQADWTAGTNENTDLTTSSGNVLLASGVDTYNPDIAAGKTCTASSTYSTFVASNAVDGNDATAWAPSTNTNSWIYVDLTANTVIRKIRCKAWPSSSSIATLQYSTDATNWTTITSFAQDLSEFIYNIPIAITARYIRVIGIDTQLWGVYSLNIYEKYRNGSIITQTLDMGAVPSANGSLCADVTIPTGASIEFRGLSQQSDSGWSTDAGDYTLLGTATATGTYTVSLSTLDLYRYKRIAAVFIKSYQTPILSNICIGTQWVSAIQDLGVIPAAYGVFNAGETKLGETITYEMNTSPNSNMSSPDGYVTVPNGTVPTNTKRRYIQYRVTFNTATANIPILSDMSLAYYTSGSQELPVFYSFKDRLYMSFMENGQSVNNITWIGQTKSVDEIKYKASNISGKPYPMYTKCNFIGASVFGEFMTTLREYSNTSGFVYNLESGYDNDGTAFTSYFVTKAFSYADAQGIWRYLYLYSKSDSAWNFYYRTRNASSVWGAWSSAKVIPISTGISRKDKFTFPGTTLADFVQFKIETTATDQNWAVQGISLYGASKRQGR